MNILLKTIYTNDSINDKIGIPRGTTTREQTIYHVGKNMIDKMMLFTTYVVIMRKEQTYVLPLHEINFAEVVNEPKKTRTDKNKRGRTKA